MNAIYKTVGPATHICMKALQNELFIWIAKNDMPNFTFIRIAVIKHDQKMKQIIMFQVLNLHNQPLWI